MRRSRRLNGLKPDTVPEPLKPVRRKAKKAPTQHKSPVRKSSSKKENVRPSRSARKTKTPKRASKTPTRSRSGKRSTPKTAPKRTTSRSTSRGRQSSGDESASSAKATRQTRSRSRRASAATAPTQARKATPKKATRSRSAKRSSKTQAKAASSSIHRKTPRRTPGGRASRRAAVERALSDASDDEDVKPSRAARVGVVPPFSMDEDEDYTPDTEEMDADEAEGYSTSSKENANGTNHSMDLTIFGIVICLIALYMLSFCRAMSCSAVTKLPWFSTMLTDFDEGATAVTTFLLYVVAFVYCRSWLRSDGFLSAEEGAFVTLHFVHGLLLVLHLLSCSIMNPNSKQSNCIASMVALSFGFYAAAFTMQLKFTVQFLRNSLTLCYLSVFYFYGKNAFGLVLLLAAKSVFWMCGAHMMDVVRDERWSMIDLVSSVGCVFLAYVVPSRM